MGAPKQLTLVEMGPGRGTMMRDALRAAQVMPEFLSAVVVELVESSDPLRAVQKETLKNAGVPVRWSRRALDPHPETPLILLANEYFDAWPVDHLRFAPTGELEQKFVTIDARDTLQFEWQRASVGQEDGYGRQGQSNHPKWFNARDAAGRILEVHNTVGYGDGYVWPIININHAKAPSAALIIDYGHAATAAGETLQAVRAHTPEHVLTSPGEADLTAHVDFEELEKLTRHRGATPLSPTFEPLTTQAEFLTRLGVIERVTRLMRSNPGQANALETGAARLLAPNGMGTRFKVLGVRSADLPTLPGFKI
jgi:SAM-dependent MidA family methyltransferase